MTRSDRWIGGIFLLFGSLVVLEASKLDFTSSYGAGSGLFPFWLGIATIILGAVLTLHALRHPAETPISPSPVSWSQKKALAYLALLVFVLTSELLGFVTAFTLLVAYLLRLEGENWPSAVSVALGSGMGFYLFFIRLLAVKLPLGPLGF